MGGLGADDAAEGGQLLIEEAEECLVVLEQCFGLRACELPTIYRADRMGRDQVLQEGMVISLEPETGVEVDGRLTILKVEDNYVVEEGGLRRLTDAQYTVFDV